MSDTYGNLLLLRDVGLLIVLATAWFWPGFGSNIFRRLEVWGSRFSQRRVASVLAITISVIVLRLSVLPLVKVPVPENADEFCYLLTADTFNHGRLANPTHPMWIFFDTFHVNQKPFYVSKYPPAQGAVLALGQVLGHPWIGVLLSVACLCGVLTWALRGWVTSRWAFLGGIIAVTQFAAVNYWMESYWGGAVAATGGALVMGAFPRILARQRIRDSFLFAAGIAILANSRPYEGGLFSVIFLGVLAWALARRKMLLRAEILAHVVTPIAITVVLAGAFIGYYNFRTTGHPLLLPYTVNNQVYMSVPPFQWQKPYPPRHYLNPQFQAFYGIARAHWPQEHLSWTRDGIKIAVLRKLKRLQAFYAPPELLIPIIVAFFYFGRSVKVRFCSVISVIFILGLLSILPFQPHYAAPFTITVYVLVVLGLCSLRRWNFKGRPVGAGLFRALISVHILLFIVQILATAVFLHGVPHRDSQWAVTRDQIKSKLQSLPGRQLALVQYSPDHDPNQEWVYNGADIDGSKVVWAREIPGQDMRPLLDYFHERNVWRVQPDAASGPRFEFVRPPVEISSHR